MTRDDFFNRLTADPEDLALHLVYADWLEEQGRPGAAEWHRGIGARYVMPWPADDRRWWYWMKDRGCGIRAPCELPDALFASLVGRKGYHHGGFGIDSARLYVTRDDAWRDLFRAVARLKESQ